MYLTVSFGAHIIVFWHTTQEPIFCNLAIVSFFITSVRSKFLSNVVMTVLVCIMQFGAYALNGHNEVAWRYTYIFIIVALSSLSLSYQLERGLRRKIVSDSKADVFIRDLRKKRLTKSKVLHSIYPKYFANKLSRGVFDTDMTLSGNGTCLVVRNYIEKWTFSSDRDAKHFLIAARRTIAAHMKRYNVELIKFDGLTAVGLHGLLDDEEGKRRGDHDEASLASKDDSWIYMLAQDLYQCKKFSFRVGVGRGGIICGIVPDSRNVVDVFGDGVEKAFSCCNEATSERRVVFCQTTAADLQQAVKSGINAESKEINVDTEDSFVFSSKTFQQQQGTSINQISTHAKKNTEATEIFADLNEEPILDDDEDMEIVIPESIDQEVDDQINKKLVSSAITRYHPFFVFISVLLYGLLGASYAKDARLLNLENPVGALIIIRLLVWTPLILLCSIGIHSISKEAGQRWNQHWTRLVTQGLYTLYLLQIVSNFLITSQTTWTDSMDQYYVIFLYMEFVLFIDFITGCSMTSHEFVRRSFLVVFITGLCAASSNGTLSQNSEIHSRIFEYLSVHAIGMALYITASQIKHQTVANEASARKKEFVQRDRIRDEIKYLSTALQSVIPSTLAHHESGDERIDIFAKYPNAFVASLRIVGLFDQMKVEDKSELILSICYLFVKIEELCQDFGVRVVKTCGTEIVLWSVHDPKDKEVTRSPEIGIVDLCIQLQDFMRGYRSKQSQGGLSCRVGLSFGDVYGGTLGTYRMSQDLWGSAVEECKELQRCGDGRGVAVSESVRALLDGRACYELQEYSGRWIVDKITDPWSIFLAYCDWMSG
eukprot:TRINITY_DN7872_c0_g1_i15.p1 TRINITY_DN7872_c0_g1~~TRINITY_DN7872_c0_g1_i15.p1  ORF type:complete len:825 (+),score=137.01 TRINITY_DN7872_c0_g1_i15:640-3114(+)